MNQLSFSDAEFQSKRKQTRREKFLKEMASVIPWERLEGQIEPSYPKAGKGRRPYPLQIMLRVYFMQQWYGLSDPGMEDALYEIASMRQFAGLSLGGQSRIPDESTILNFRRLLEERELTEALFTEVNNHLAEQGLLLRRGTVVDATIINAPSSTKNKEHQRDPEMHQTRKGNQWYFSMKAHIGTDVDSGVVHSLTGTAANASDISETHNLLHGEEDMVFGDAGYTGVEKRDELKDRDVDWHIAMKRGKLKETVERGGKIAEATEAAEKAKASIRAFVEHPFRILKCQFGHRKTRYRGIKKNTAQLYTLFALANIYMMRKELATL